MTDSYDINSRPEGESILMPRILTKHFPAGEAAWYATPAGRRHTEREYRKALKEGTLVRSEKVDVTVLEQLMHPRKGERSSKLSRSFCYGAAKPKSDSLP